MIRTGEKSLVLTEKADLRKFGLIVSCIFLALGLSPILKGKDSNFFMIVPAIILIFFAVILPKILLPFYRVWMRLGKILGKINSFIVLSLIFYFVLTPLGIVRRALKIDSRKFAYKINENSHWIKKIPGNPKDKMERTF